MLIPSPRRAQIPVTRDLSPPTPFASLCLIKMTKLEGLPGQWAYNLGKSVSCAFGEQNGVYLVYNLKELYLRIRSPGNTYFKKEHKFDLWGKRPPGKKRT